MSSKEDSGVDPLEQLQKKLAASPTDSETAFELADLLERESSVEEAEKCSLIFWLRQATT